MSQAKALMMASGFGLRLRPLSKLRPGTKGWAGSDTGIQTTWAGSGMQAWFCKFWIPQFGA